MFFPERIKNIKPSDRVLEIGPGGSPHPRSDVLLEKIFSDQNEARGQRGYAPELKSDKEIVFYEGGKFPFRNKEFDYVICSHVIEHIEDVDFFVSEIMRVGRKGYFEYPTIYYDYIYNFPEHTTFVIKKNNIINWMLKEESGLNNFSIVNKFFYDSFVKGYSDLVNDLKPFFFQGFEWEVAIETNRVNDISYVCFDMSEIYIPFRVEKKSSILESLKRIFLVSK